MAPRGKKNKRKTRGDGYPDDGPMANAKFNEYYKMQDVIPETEWEAFLAKAIAPLPTTFRLSGSRIIAHDVNNIIRDVHVPALKGVSVQDVVVDPPQVLPWYPGGLAWQFNVDKSTLRRSPEYKKFHRFLVYETDNGNISRSEAVSMLPPLFLDVEPHHKVLDMCAAPGSKTAQLLEALHAEDASLGTSTPPGMLVANDSNFKRAQMLVHQLARLPSPALMVINLDASNMPNILDQHKRPVHFDRVLADVPCSGDGTTRKNPGVWKDWRPMNGMGLHPLQLRILQRAMKILEHHGRIVYSTCSLNPIENEAVVAAALASNPEFELVDVSDRMPELQRRPGMTTWKVVVDNELHTCDDYESYAAAPKPPKGKVSNIQPTHFPPKDPTPLHLERCMRIYPHLQDTGGFFVAVLEKKHDCRPATEVASTVPLKRRHHDDPETEAKRRKVNPESSEAVSVEHTDPADSPAGDSSSYKEIPFTLLAPDNSTLLDAMSKVHLSLETFPRDRVFVRNPEGHPARALYLTNPLVKDALLANSCERLRIVHAGVRVIEKKDAGIGGAITSFRILEEGVAPLLPYVDETKIISGNLVALRMFLEEYFPPISRLPEPMQGVVEDLGVGNVLCRFEADTTPDASLPHSVVLPLFKSGVSIAMMTDKKAKSAMSFRVFGEDITPTGKKLLEAQNAKGVNADTSDPMDVVDSAAGDSGSLAVEEAGELDVHEQS
ncbi:S-adenosyl-L-methionine-dependent methyltransferase [Auriculariales sp. MPI-PUGE-AT-0066]|nr:S-adenosyl-L-methionine-dependent methyltransferase [Auriculariales sp. MPI-PUGE-AT-0066]